ncbi:MAG TPA: cache domain-containing protein [Anaeromyxobacteraceae bacterium]|nr:cache domain-containing protein [Anaeromyxobacteraceae bacterium]
MAAVVGVSLASGLGGAWLVGRVLRQEIEDAGREAMRSAAETLAAVEQAEVEKLSATLDALLANDALRAAFLRRDRARLLALSQPIFATLRERDRVTHWYFVDPSRTVFLRVHLPELRGDLVDRETLRRAVETRERGAGKELGKTAFALRVVRPWVVDGQLAGYVELAEEMDAFLAAMKARTGDDLGLLLERRVLAEKGFVGLPASSWNERPDVVMVATAPAVERLVGFGGGADAVPDAGLPLGEVEQGDRSYLRGVVPLRDVGGRRVGALLVLHDFSGEHAALRAALQRSFVLLLAVALAAAALVGLAVHRIVFLRLGRLRRRIEARAAAAGLPVASAVLSGNDEVGRLEALVDRVLPDPSPPEEPAARVTGSHDV